jgi:hypothetical protein
MRFPRDIKLRNRIVAVVRKLQQLDSGAGNLALVRSNSLKELENELDATIFDLYELTPAERDMIRETCSLGLDLFYRHHKGEALRQVVQPTRTFGTLSDLPPAGDGLSAYLRIFLEIWNAELAPDGELAWRVLSPPSGAPLLAVSFTTRYRRDAPPVNSSDTDVQTWSKVLTHLQQDSLAHGGSSRIFVDTFYRYVGDREILFIKRNERRFWTRTAAREDAESALTHLMNVEDAASGGER